MSIVDFNPTRGALDDRENAAFVLVDGKYHKAVYSRISNALVIESFDAIGATYPTATTEVYSYYTGGLAGTLVATVTVTYTDSTKEVLVSAVRT